MEQSNETIVGMSESVQTEGVAPTRPQAPQVGDEALRRSERHRKETYILKEAREGFLQLAYALGQFKRKISCV